MVTFDLFWSISTFVCCGAVKKSKFMSSPKSKILFLFSFCRGELVQPVSDLRQGSAANPAPPWCGPGDQVQRQRQALAPSLRLPQGQARRLLRSHPTGTQWFREEGGEAWFWSVTACCFSVGGLHRWMQKQELLTLLSDLQKQIEGDFKTDW